SEEPAVRTVHLAQVAPQRLLAVVVLDSGQAVHRFCEVPRDLSPSEVTELGTALDDLLRDLPISRVGSAPSQVDALAAHADVLKALVAVIGRGVAGEDGELY